MAVASDTSGNSGNVSTRVLTVTLLCGFYICVSSMLIRFNKYLMHEDRFPYSMPLSSLHMAFSLMLCSIFYAVRPECFPGMAATAGKRSELLRWFVPIGMAFAGSLYCSNLAYSYSNVAFLQFMKEGNVIITFLISCAAGLQVMNRVRLAVVFWIMAFSALSVGSELNFVFIGFVIQLASQVAECCRVVLGECVLGGSGLKLDPLTYTLFAAPAGLVVLVFGNIFTWHPEIVTRAMQHWHLLLPNALLAFVLNVTVATVIKEVSAVGFILAGVTKDIVLVTVSATLFGEQITHLQAFGFSMVLAGILLWSLMKALPKHPVVRSIEDSLGLPRPEETAPLVKAEMGKALPAV